MTVSRHTLTAYLDSADLEAKTASITLDNSWSPYIQGTITIPIPDSTTLDALDPRNQPRVQLFLTQDFGDSLEVSYFTGLFSGLTVAAMTAAYTGLFLSAMTARFFLPWNGALVIPSTRRDLNLSVRGRSIDHRDGEVTLTLSSDEGFLQDYALVSETIYRPEFTQVKTAVTYALSKIGAQLQTTTLDGSINPDAAAWLPGHSAWDYLVPLLTATELRLYCDENRFWYLVPDNATVEGTLVLSDQSTIILGTDDITRDGDWFDAVVVQYNYLDTVTGLTSIVYDAADNGNPTKVNTIVYETFYPGPGAAARILARATGRGRQQSVTAVNDYTVTPGQEARIKLPGTLETVGSVRSVVWTLPGDTMSIEASGLIEVPDTAWIKVAAGIRWQDIPAGTSWNTFTP